MKLRRHHNNKGSKMVKSGSAWKSLVRKLPKALRKKVKF